MGDAGTFSGAEDRWAQGLGSLRDVVRQHVVAVQLREVLSGRGPLHVLDVGCGQGTQALALARDGHAVTGLDPSSALLDHFLEALTRESDDVRERVRLVQGTGEDAAALTPGPYDVVLCHGVLMYLDDAQVGHLLQALTAVAGPAAVLSLLVRNGLAPAMRPGLLGRYAKAAASFDSDRYVNRLGVAARMHTPAQAGILGPLGWAPDRWSGVRALTDHVGGPAPAGDELRELLAAEVEAGRRDPYRQVAALLHVVFERRRRLDRDTPSGGNFGEGPSV